MDQPDPVSDLLDDLLSQDPSNQRDRLEALCAEHPTVGESLRSRYEALERLGLLDGATDEAEHELTVPKRLGRFVRSELLGRGGMGLVFAGTEEGSGRSVAIKCLRTDWGPDDGAIHRFQREAEILATLDHSSIARLIGSGSCDGQPYLVVERIHGPGLDALIDSLRNRVPEERSASVLSSHLEHAVTDPARRSWEQAVAGLLAPIADALGFAHARGVVHRDVKPSNVLVDRHEGPKLLDFGLADWDEASALTRSGTVLGSAAYMSPEQTLGHECDGRSDIFSLGSTLYELLTMEAPFGRGSSPAVLQAIREQDPIDPRKRDPRVSAVAAAVVLRCLEKSPRHRYQDAYTLAADLRALAEGAPVRARLPSPTRRTLRFVRRRPWQATAAVSVLLLLIGLSAVTGFLGAKRQVLEAGERAIEADRIGLLWEEALFEVLGSNHRRAEMRLRELAAIPFERADALAYLEIIEGGAIRAGAAGSPALEALRPLVSSHRPTAEQIASATDALRTVVFSRSRARATDHASLAFALSQTERAAERRSIATSLRSIWPKSPFANYWAGYVLLGLDAEGASQALERAIALDGTRARFHADLGLARFQAGALEAAESSLRRAIELRDDDGRSWSNLGHVVTNQGRHDQAMKAYQRAVTAEPGWPGGHYALGVALSERGETDAAIERFRRTLELAPDYSEAAFNLGNLLLARASVAEGVAVLEGLTEREPHWSQAWRALGIGYWTRGDLESARQAYRSLVALPDATAEDRKYLASLDDALSKRNADGAEKR